MKDMKDINNELISVIIPVYNVEKYLINCIESVLNQSYRNLEIILVDDGSTDDSGKICDEYIKKDIRIRVYHKNNGGLSDARNYGIDHASGKYITFIDSDDDVSTEYISDLYILIKKYNVNISITPLKICAKNSYKRTKLKRHEEILLPKIAFFERLLCDNGFGISICGKMFLTRLFDDIKFPYGCLCEDNGTTYKLFDKCQHVAYVSNYNYNYYKRNNSIMKSEFIRKKLDLIIMTDEMCDYLEKYPELSDSVNKRRINARFSILRQISESTLDIEKLKIRDDMIDYIKKIRNILQIMIKYHLKKRLRIIH